MTSADHIFSLRYKLSLNQRNILTCKVLCYNYQLLYLELLLDHKRYQRYHYMVARSRWRITEEIITAENYHFSSFEVGNFIQHTCKHYTSKDMKKVIETGVLIEKGKSKNCFIANYDLFWDFMFSNTYLLNNMVSLCSTWHLELSESLIKSRFGDILVELWLVYKISFIRECVNHCQSFHMMKKLKR